MKSRDYLGIKDGKAYLANVPLQQTPEQTAELAYVMIGTQCLGMEFVNDSGNVDLDALYALPGVPARQAIELTPLE